MLAFYCVDVNSLGSVQSFKGDHMFKGFKNFLLRGDLIIIAVGLVVALAFSTLISAFTDNVITPMINGVVSSNPASPGLGWTINGKFVNLGAFLAAIIYFVIFMMVVYLVLVVPYRRYMAKQGTPVFAAPTPPPSTKTCPECLSSDLPAAATRCLHCTSVVA
jgi:large conductance mechanosensitive channel